MPAHAKWTTGDLECLRLLHEEGKTAEEMVPLLRRRGFAPSVSQVKYALRNKREPRSPLVEAEPVDDAPAREPRYRSRRSAPQVVVLTIPDALIEAETLTAVRALALRLAGAAPLPGYAARVAESEEDAYHALMTVRAAARARGAELVVVDRSRLLVAERPANRWDRDPAGLDRFFVVPLRFFLDAAPDAK